MTQPPDERDPATGADKDADAKPPEDQPTVAWTPPEPAPEPPPEPAPAPPAQPSEPAAPASPIIAADPTPPPPATSAWPQPPDAAPGPIVGWQTPGAAVAAPAAEGYVIAGAGARLVAYLIDSVLVGIVPGILGLFLFDYASMFEEIMRQSAAGATATTTTFTIPVTTDYILLTLISVAITFLYFVGFWTSGWRATPGMRGLKMRVVDAGTGNGLSIAQATKRWIALGFPLGLLALIEPLQSAAGLISFAVTVFLFFTVITNDRKQGLHDKFANSLVIRSVTSGDGATVVGCLVLVALAIGFSIIASAALFAALGPEFEQLMIDIGNSV